MFRFNKKTVRLLVSCVALVMALLFSVGKLSPEWAEFFGFQREEQSGLEEKLRVERVVDGDTVELKNGEKVRYTGINTPETVKPNGPIECFGEEGSAKNKELVEGKSVRLERDISDRDKYGRLLRYVYLEDGTFVNDVLVREGYAYASTFPPDVKFADQFRTAQSEARANHRGLWAEETCGGTKNRKQ